MVAHRSFALSVLNRQLFIECNFRVIINKYAKGTQLSHKKSSKLILWWKNIIWKLWSSNFIWNRSTLLHRRCFSWISNALLRCVEMIKRARALKDPCAHLTTITQMIKAMYTTPRNYAQTENNKNSSYCHICTFHKISGWFKVRGNQFIIMQWFDPWLRGSNILTKYFFCKGSKHSLDMFIISGFWGKASFLVFSF